MFKHNLGQTVYFMHSNKVHSGVVTNRSYNDEVIKDGTSKEYIKYAVGGNWYFDSNIFSSFDALVGSLRSTIQTA
jgi:hypothetical protein